jgi:hypothetical protein
MDSRKNFALPGVEIEKKTGKDTEHPERQDYHGTCFMQVHVRTKEIAVNHDDPRRNAAQHGDECNSTGNDMALPEKLYRFAEMQAFGTLEPQVNSVKSYQNGKQLRCRVDTQDKSHY